MWVSLFDAGTGGMIEIKNKNIKRPKKKKSPVTEVASDVFVHLHYGALVIAMGTHLLVGERCIKKCQLLRLEELAFVKRQ